MCAPGGAPAHVKTASSEHRCAAQTFCKTGSARHRLLRAQLVVVFSQKFEKNPCCSTVDMRFAPSGLRHGQGGGCAVQPPSGSCMCRRSDAKFWRKPGHRTQRKRLRQVGQAHDYLAHWAAQCPSMLKHICRRLCIRNHALQIPCMPTKHC